MNKGQLSQLTRPVLRSTTGTITTTTRMATAITATIMTMTMGMIIRVG